jgi:omega-6 fatty acid desaturase (delta-12 desaturase)
VFGVLTGLSTYVWSRHHAYHHSTNGNWEKYRGPLSTKTVYEFEAMTERQRRNYERARKVWLAPLGGFSYLIFSPRYNWLKGSIDLVCHLVKSKIARPTVSLRAHAAGFKTRYWNNADEYWHMFGNNVALLSTWALMSWWMGPALFFPVYLVSTSLAGGAAIALFAVQHNFEHAYAADTKAWDYDAAVTRGTSFLVFPRWLHWLTANIAYHHVHHMSARIPNFLLPRCHEEHQDLFTEVTRVDWFRIHTALKYILWDTRSQRIISVAEYRQNQRKAWLGAVAAKQSTDSSIAAVATEPAYLSENS